MKLFQNGIILLFIFCAQFITGQETSFNSFLSRLSDQYEVVDVALAPELIPTLDSIRNLGTEITSIEVLLQQLLSEKEISYRIIDGNKILLRRETIQIINGLIEIRGRIIDQATGLPLPFVAASLESSGRGTYSDNEGYFKMYVNDTTGILHISYLGFKSIAVPVSSLVAGEQIIRMEVSNIPLDQVVIIVPFHQMSADEPTQSVSLKGYQFISTSDLLAWNSERLINHLTGYTHFSSEHGIRIRGSEAENALIVMDNLPVYDPYHFYNIFSPFNGHYFTSVNLYKNNMPVQYGGRVDGMIKLSSDARTSHGSSLIIDTDLLLSSVTGDLALSKKIRLTAGGRLSHTGMLNEALSDSSTSNFSLPGKFRDENEWTSTEEPTFNFYDVNGRLSADIGAQSNLNVSYFKSKDYLDNVISNSLQTTGFNHSALSIGQTLRSRDDWQNEGLVAGFNSSITKALSIEAAGFLSFYEKNISYTSILKEEMHNMVRISTNAGFQNSLLQSRGMKALITSHSDNESRFTAGIDFQHHEIDLVAKENNTPYLLEVQSENEATLFGEYVYKISNDLILTPGVRMTHLSSTRRFYPQPNVKLNYELNDNVTLKASYSKNIQSVRELTVENRFGRETELLALSSPESGYPVLKSDKYMIGTGYGSDHFNVDAEIFYKKTFDLINVRAPRPNPSFDDQTSPGDFYRFYTGDGWTAGLDVLAAYKSKKADASLSYTFSKISHQFERLFNGNSFSPKEDRRHQVKLTTQYKIGSFKVSGLLTYKTKAPYVSLVRLEGQGGIDMVEQGMVIRYLPPYFSMDLGLDYSFRLFTQPAQIGISLVNATNHVNINDLQHIGGVSRGNGGESTLFLTHETELLGRTFNIHFRYLIN